METRYILQCTVFHLKYLQIILLVERLKVCGHWGTHSGAKATKPECPKNGKYDPGITEFHKISVPSSSPLLFRILSSLVLRATTIFFSVMHNQHAFFLGQASPPAMTGVKRVNVTCPENTIFLGRALVNQPLRTRQLLDQPRDWPDTNASSGPQQEVSITRSLQQSSRLFDACIVGPYPSQMIA